MKKTKVSQGTISYTLKALEKFAIITREHHYRKNGSNSSNLYTITLNEIDIEEYYAYKKDLQNKKSHEDNGKVHPMNHKSSSDELCNLVHVLKQGGSQYEPEDSSLPEIAYNESPLLDHQLNQHSVSTKGFKTLSTPSHLISTYKDHIIKKYKGKQLLKKTEEPWGTTIISVSKDGYLINSTTQERLTDEEDLMVWKWIFENQDKFKKTKLGENQ